MATWASRRRLLYASILILGIIACITLVYFLVFYKAPTCFDNKQNGGELGIDCGGKCKRLCQSYFQSPRIEWGAAKIEKLADGLYNVASYIENPNINGAAVDVPYKVSLYDAQGIFIVEKSGTVTLYPRRNSLAFETAVNTQKRIPTKATFEFTSAPKWFKSDDKLGGIVVVDKRYSENENGSSLEVVLDNNNLLPYNDVRVSVILYDSGGNVIGFSQTVVDHIPGKNSIEKKALTIAPYTWPSTRNGKVATIEVIPSIEPTVAN